MVFIIQSCLFYEQQHINIKLNLILSYDHVRYHLNHSEFKENDLIC